MEVSDSLSTAGLSWVSQFDQVLPTDFCISDKNYQETNSFYPMAHFTAVPLYML